MLRQVIPSVFVAVVMCLSPQFSCRQASGDGPRLEYAYEILDWVPKYKDLNQFKALVDEAEGIGFNTIEISVAWKDIEPSRGNFQWDYVDQRIQYILGKGLKLRTRINFSYAGLGGDRS